MKPILNLKRSFITMILTCFLSTFLPFTAHASTIQTVPKDKVFSVKFNISIDYNYINSYVTVKDSKNKAISVIVSKGTDDKTLVINPPTNGYSKGKYTLTISNVIGKNKSKQKTPYIKEFEVIEDVKTVPTTPTTSTDSNTNNGTSNNTSTNTNSNSTTDTTKPYPYKVYNINKTVSENGVYITLDKIEVKDDVWRVFVTTSGSPLFNGIYSEGVFYKYDQYYEFTKYDSKPHYNELGKWQECYLIRPIKNAGLVDLKFYCNRQTYNFCNIKVGESDKKPYVDISEDMIWSELNQYLVNKYSNYEINDKSINITSIDVVNSSRGLSVFVHVNADTYLNVMDDVSKSKKKIEDLLIKISDDMTIGYGYGLSETSKLNICLFASGTFDEKPVEIRPAEILVLDDIFYVATTLVASETVTADFDNKRFNYSFSWYK